MCVFVRGVGGAGAGTRVTGAAGLASWRRKRRADTLGHCMIHLRRIEDEGGRGGGLSHENRGGGGLYSQANLLRGKPNLLSRGPVAGLLDVVVEAMSVPLLSITLEDLTW